MEPKNRHKRTGGRVFTDLNEIFRNNTVDSLWLLIDNKVYDVTNFKHPGSLKLLLNNAGTDATQAFEDIGHSPDAQDWLDKLYIGDYVDKSQENEKDKPIKPNDNQMLDRLLMLAVFSVVMLVLVAHYAII